MNLKRKILPNIIIIALLTSTTIYFLDIVVYQSPKTEILSKSYDEKMKNIDPYLYGIFTFVKYSVEPDSTVLFFLYNYYILAKPYLYPKIKATYIRYRNDNILLIYLQNNLIDYVIIIREPLHLASNTTLFTKIDYLSSIYLLKVNRSAL